MINDYEDFKVGVLRLTGINLTAYKERQMKRRIDSLILKNQFETYNEYLYALKTNKTLYDEFMNFITINVSEFFRNLPQWEVLEKEILPMLLQGKNTLRVWSAACSTGEEPYSLVMLLSKFMPLSLIKIMATDIDGEVLAKAKDGIYAAKCINSIPKEFQKYFIPEGDYYRVADEIKRCVSFSQMDLLKDQYPIGIDLIVCRNVMIYFTEEAKIEMYKKFNNSLRPNGILFVGSTEQIILCNKYKFTPIRTFFYRKEGDV